MITVGDFMHIVTGQSLALSSLTGDAVPNFIRYARSFEEAREQRQYIINVQFLAGFPFALLSQFGLGFSYKHIATITMVIAW